MSRPPGPPRLAAAVVRAVIPPGERSDVLGDLAERFARRVVREDRARAVRWYWREVWRLAWRVPRERARGARFRRAPNRRVGSFNLRQDLTYAVRTLRRAPTFALITILTLGLGIGVNTAIYSVVHGVLLRPLPYPEPDRIMTVWQVDRRGREQAVSPANYVDLVGAQSSFDRLGATLFRPFARSLQVGDELMRITSHMVTPNLFPMLGVTPILGRTFAMEEGVVGNDRVMVISHGFWQRVFGGDSSVLGREVSLAGTPYAIVGVLPDDFYFITPTTDLWLPFAFNPAFHFSMARDQRRVSVLNVVGRLAPGVSPAGAERDLGAIMVGLAAQHPDDNAGVGVLVRPLHRQLVSEVRGALLLLLGAVGLVLLITCVNVAILLVARSLGRARELATRVALGAGRSRLISQVLVESLVLSVAGGVVGVGVGFGGMRGLLWLLPGTIPRQHEIALDGNVLAFALIVSVVTGVLFAIVPARLTMRADVATAMRDRVAGVRGAAGRRMRGGLVVSETALAFVLLVGAGLLFRSFAAVLGVDPGFRTANLFTVGAGPPPSRAGSAGEIIEFYREMQTRVEALPGVEGATWSSRVPLSGVGVTGVLGVEGRAVPRGEWPEIEFRRATPGYFRAMGIPLLAGRGFGAQDTPEAPRVAVINDAARREFFPEDDPVGRRVQWSAADGAPLYTIVGVVGDVRHFGLDRRAEPELYVSMDQVPSTSTNLFVRTTGDPSGVISAVAAVLREMNPTVPVPPATTMDQIVGGSLAPRRFSLGLLGGFAALALVLVSLGMYGVVSRLVHERSSEFGIRIALGASPREILGRVLKTGLQLTAVGVGVGLVVALAGGRVLESFLYRVRATDVVTLVGVTVLLGTVSLLAALAPARRAGRVAVVEALRIE